MRSFAIFALAFVALVVASVHAKDISVTVKNGATEKKIEMQAETNSVMSIISEFKQQTGLKGDNWKLKYPSGKEINEEHMISETQIKDGDVLTLVKV